MTGRKEGKVGGRGKRETVTKRWRFLFRVPLIGGPGRAGQEGLFPLSFSPLPLVPLTLAHVQIESERQIVAVSLPEGFRRNIG